MLITASGNLGLRIPMPRQGYLLPELLDRRRADQALFAVVVKVYVHRMQSERSTISAERPARTARTARTAKSSRPKHPAAVQASIRKPHSLITELSPPGVSLPCSLARPIALRSSGPASSPTLSSSGLL